MTKQGSKSALVARHSGSTAKFPADRADSAEQRVGVIDVGSNSVRLVVYDGLRRTPMPLFNEKVFCGLGRSVTDTGRIEGEAAESARTTLRRFAMLLRAMNVGHVEAVATAASREAVNGAAFIADLSQEIGLNIRIISGAEEGRFSALGVLAGNPRAAGLVGDLGSSSIELIAIGEGTFGRAETLPMGPLKVKKATPEQLDRRIDEMFSNQDWLRNFAGDTFYAVGGSWRALAQAHMESIDHPVRIIHEYEISASEAMRFTAEISRKPQAALELTPGLSKRRAESAAPAAAILNCLLRQTQVRRVVFSAYGLREGILFDHLPKSLQVRDPLVSACEEKCARLGRFPDHADEITRWTAPLFPDETESARRLRHCASLLSDIGWRVHPDHRANHALMEVVNSQFVGITHRGRVLLALAVYFRYRSDQAEGEVSRLWAYAGESAEKSRILGLALRLGHTISGGTAGVLGNCSLQLLPNELCLHMPANYKDLVGDALIKRLRQLGQVLGLKTRIVIG
jgi:exopolyphosphatase/guanosine-5'-triphosphate,3'-diphosphate pyrophosphatase